MCGWGDKDARKPQNIKMQNVVHSGHNAKWRKWAIDTKPTSSAAGACDALDGGGLSMTPSGHGAPKYSVVATVSPMKPSSARGTVSYLHSPVRARKRDGGASGQVSTPPPKKPLLIGVGIKAPMWALLGRQALTWQRW